MTDQDFLFWIHQRLVCYGDSELVDFMHRLRAIIKSIPKDRKTPIATICNSSTELIEQLKEGQSYE